LVDDHRDTLRVMCRLLESQGHQVFIADNVRSAAQVAREQPIDLLISDVGLPDGSGHDLMRIVRQEHPDLPGIALSGYGMEEDMAKSRQAGFGIHLTKPVNVQQLTHAIEQVSSVT
jgi:CheY-like chemotaxis protein